MQKNQPTSKNDAEQTLECILNQKTTKVQFLLHKADKIRNGNASRIIENILLFGGGFMLLQIYAYIQSNGHDMKHFVFFLLLFIIAVASRCLQKCDNTNKQLALLSKAIQELQQNYDSNKTAN